MALFDRQLSLSISDLSNSVSVLHCLRDISSFTAVCEAVAPICYRPTECLSVCGIRVLWLLTLTHIENNYTTNNTLGTSLAETTSPTIQVYAKVPQFSDEAEVGCERGWAEDLKYLWNGAIQMWQKLQNVDIDLCIPSRLMTYSMMSHDL